MYWKLLVISILLVLLPVYSIINKRILRHLSRISSEDELHEITSLLKITEVIPWLLEVIIVIIYDVNVSIPVIVIIEFIKFWAILSSFTPSMIIIYIVGSVIATPLLLLEEIICLGGGLETVLTTLTVLLLSLILITGLDNIYRRYRMGDRSDGRVKYVPF